MHVSNHTFVIFPVCISNIRMTPFGRLITFVGHENFTQIWLEDAISSNAGCLFPGDLIIGSSHCSFCMIIAMLLNGKSKRRECFV